MYLAVCPGSLLLHPGSLRLHPMYMEDAVAYGAHERTESDRKPDPAPRPRATEGPRRIPRTSHCGWTRNRRHREGAAQATRLQTTIAQRADADSDVRRPRRGEEGGAMGALHT